MSCNNFNGLVPRDAQFSNLTVDGLLDTCSIAVAKEVAGLQEVITFDETPGETGIYRVQPNHPVTTLKFSDTIRQNTSIFFDIDNTFARLNDQIILDFQALNLDNLGDPVSMRIETPYPMYWFSYNFSSPTASIAYLDMTGGDVYAVDTIIPSKIRIQFFYDGLCWINTYFSPLG